MRQNRNIVLHGRVVALLPYWPKHVTRRHDYLQEPGNRLDRSQKSPSLEDETKMQQLFLSDERRAVFLIADTTKLSDPRVPEADSIVGESHIIFTEDSQLAATLQLMIFDRSVRRRTILSEALLMTIMFGARDLGVRTFIYTLFPPAGPDDNRLAFSTRETEDKPASAPVSSERQLSKRLTQVGKKITGAFKKKKTDYLSNLTSHLLKQDSGAHWPPELDFELVGPSTLELNLTAANIKVLQQVLCEVHRAKYSSLANDETLKLNTNTKVSGGNIVLLPYTKDAVAWCSDVLVSDKDFCSALGYQEAPSGPSCEAEQQQMWTGVETYCFIAVLEGKCVGRCSARIGQFGDFAELSLAVVSEAAESLTTVLLLLIFLSFNVLDIDHVVLARRPHLTATLASLVGTPLEFVPLRAGYFKLEPSKACQEELRKLVPTANAEGIDPAAEVSNVKF
eukprot:m.156766 g.156766  ORF g.156766 m.156766 type:complete len:451 (+) comp17568_c0_seq2:136-1488(+)